MNLDLKKEILESSLRGKIKHYKGMAHEIEKYLLASPNEWGKFQSEFNLEVDSIFRDIMNFEKENIASDREDRVYKLKRLFINRIRSTFIRGDCIDASLRKPFGYSGDFRIIEDIYENNPSTTGFNRLFDNYFQMSAISIAVRNRKNDFKRMIVEFIKDRKNSPLRIMSLASGPCREIREMFSENLDLCENVVFDCYDNDENSIKFASTLLSNFLNVNFLKENAMRIAFRKNIYSLIDKKYDIIYSTGLFDYFEEKISIRIIENLKKILKPGGVLLISDVRDKYSNPSVHFMEWVGDWNLVYRDDESFREIFCKAGFDKKDLEPRYEQQGILQYIIGISK